MSDSNQQQSDIEVFGTPLSTFTRSITMGLHELGHSDFKQHDLKPHDVKIEQLNPFGLLPIFIHTSLSVKLFETAAIRRYIDTTLAADALRPMMPASSLDAAQVELWVALASTQLFPAAELGVIKPRLAMEEKGEAEDKITQEVAAGVEKLRQVLGKLEGLIKADDEWLAGSTLTWADTFVYPPLADLLSIPEADVILGTSSTSFPKLNRWFTKIQERDSAKQTRAGTLASQRSAS